MEVFNDAIGYCAILQEEGRIERFDVVLFQPNGALNGLMLFYGTHEQLVAVREDDRFQRFMMDAQLVVDGLSVTEGWANEGVAQPMGRFLDAVATTQQSQHASS
jgi:hypothetical protein